MDIVFKSNLVAVKREIRSGMRNNMYDAVEYLKDKIKDKLSRTQGSGRIYFSLSKTDRNGKIVFKRIHQASSPNEPPVMFTGDLRESIDSYVKETAYELEGRVYTYDEKARTLEFGDFSRHIAKRPFFKNTFEENKEKIQNILHRNIEDKYHRRYKEGVFDD